MMGNNSVQAAPIVGIPAQSTTQRWFLFCLMAATILAPTYNGLFAMLNARGLHTPKAAAIGAELSILLLAFAGCVFSGRRPHDIGPVALMFFMVLIGLFLSLTNDTIYPDLIRNVGIICCFTALGFRTSNDQIITIFRIVSGLVLVCLLLEMMSLQSYVWVFQPAAYLEASRGIQQFELNDTGLFANALGFQDRFSFGVFTGPRTSSLFIEQVSLPGYAAVALVFTSAKWFDLTRWDRIMQIGLIVLIVLSNNSRTSAALLVVMAMGFFIFPFLPSRLTILLPVFCLGAAFLIVGPMKEPTGGDDLVGRLSVTVANLNHFDLKMFVFGSLPLAYHSFDSGYVYVIASSTLWGFLAFCLYITLVPGCVSPAQKRAHWGVAFYIYTWLLIGGTAIFTMKTAALLWLLIGHMVYNQSLERKPVKLPPLRRAA